MIFVDASALVSLASQEEDALDLAGVLESHQARLTSPIALWETAAALCRSHIFSVEFRAESVEGAMRPVRARDRRDRRARI